MTTPLRGAAWPAPPRRTYPMTILSISCQFSKQLLLPVEGSMFELIIAKKALMPKKPIS
jgi:hypothetical protein